MIYEIKTRNKNVNKKLKEYNLSRDGIEEKLERLKINPRTEIGAHPLHGKLKGKWACWLASNIRIIYEIDDKNKIIVIEAVGMHKIS